MYVEWLVQVKAQMENLLKQIETEWQQKYNQKNTQKRTTTSDQKKKVIGWMFGWLDACWLFEWLTGFFLVAGYLLIGCFNN